MENSNRGLVLMIAHHGLIEALLITARDSMPNTVQAEKFFNDFKWQLEKHFFVEEQVNFGPIVSTQPGLSDVVQKLVNEHEKMTKMAEGIKVLFDASAPEIDFEEMFALLKKHRETEEQVLYPRFSSLSQAELDEVVSRINEVVITGPEE